ncbi:MAG TPA: choice-of-anchor tandem repeat GloVer-containing protein [Candidatus Cybelea sp.]|nr:choice-of-anchor tandem repeat GloVer-containing protein [Candidatus Cybelea sp.]
MRNCCGLISTILATLLVAGCGGALTPATGSGASYALHRAAPAGKSSNGYKLLYSFKGTPDGASPYGGLVALNGTLYGTTLNGSTNYCSQSCSNYCYLGCGTVFSITKGGSEHVIYNFRGNFDSAHDGSWPFAGLTAVNGVLYGTASSAGAYGSGAVYTVSIAGQERLLYSFQGGTDGGAPEAPLIAASSGHLAGTTVVGGGNGCGGSGCGTAYQISAKGHDYRVVHKFAGGNDGDRIYAPLVHLGKLYYGAALEGGGTGCGGNGCGAIFDTTDRGKEHVLYRFSGTSDGAFPNGLTAVNGVLYGTTEGGGTRNSGTFFSITTAGTLTTLYNFLDIPDGNLPGATMIAHKGTLYGTTVGGGTVGSGTVFSMTTSGTEKVLYSFQGGSDGADPQGPVYLFDKMLYGTTTAGGGTGCSGSGCGTVFRVKP